MKSKGFLCLLLTFIPVSLFAQMNDSARVALLNSEGLKSTQGNVIVWSPKNALSEKRLSDIMDTLNVGIDKARNFLGSPLPWQVFGSGPVTYYLCDDDFVPHTSLEGFVMMPWKRFTQNKALWFHETIHILLRANKGNWNEAPQQVAIEKMPLWLTEGMPEYISMKLSFENNLKRYDVWQDGGWLSADSACLAKLNHENGSYVLNFIGKTGVLMELFGKNRMAYAPTFYNCSCSFTKYLVEKYGIGVLLEGIAAYPDEQATIEKKTSANLLSLKSSWLKQIGYAQK